MLIEKGALIEATTHVRIHSRLRIRNRWLTTSHTHTNGSCAAQASLVKVVYSKLMQSILASVTYVQRALIESNLVLHISTRT